MLQVNVDERIKLDDIPLHPWIRGEARARCPAPGVTQGQGLPIPLRTAPHLSLGLNSVGSSHSSQSPPHARPGLHTKLCRKPGNLGPLGTKKTDKNMENSELLLASEYPKLSHGRSQASMMTGLGYSIKDLKNETNEAMRSGVMEDNKSLEVGGFPGANCRVKVERMEAGDSIHLVSQASAYATL